MYMYCIFLDLHFACCSLIMHVDPFTANVISTVIVILPVFVIIGLYMGCGDVIISTVWTLLRRHVVGMKSIVINCS